ncbi:MAG: energy-coupled thiamine transporter ThiT [Firmicutes bacterium HGW-Firmicutes-16]|nr:MAG: energy-coupled thiamine transporter ThiT [Firmicutes bacterium HGW-Firmicutes-16]
MKTKLKRIADSAMLIAIGTVLSLFTFQGPWLLGGGITVCSMLPLVMIAQRYGTKWGIFSSLIYSVLQMFIGLNNVQYAPTALSAAGVVVFDYILAYTVLGFSACFNNLIANRRKAIVLGILVTFSGRFLCHFISGVLIWEALFPNELGWASPVWSLVYNASYMIPEILITSIVAYLSYKPLKRYWLREDIVQ